MKKIFYIYALIGIMMTALFAESFAEYQKSQNQSFNKYQKNIQEEFKAYKKAHDIEYKKYKQNIKKKWGKPEVSTKHKWVEYDKNLNSKKVADFKKQEIRLEVIAKDDKEAKKRLQKMYKKMLEENNIQAYKNDILEKKIYKRIHKTRPKFKPKAPQKIVGDLFANNKPKITKKTIKKKKFKGKTIYLVKIKFPPNSMQKKASYYKDEVLKNAEKFKIPPNLIFAIMHSESSFNPMAKSHIPAYGLMQIVPRTAGIDTYQYLYGKKKMLNSSYLFDANNNIKIGSAYLHIIYYKYLKKIKNDTSRLYCTICAYNTGAGNVSKSFSGNKNISRTSKIINRYSHQEVYGKLLRNLPYDETKHYLKKVTSRYEDYGKLLGENR